MTDTASTPSLSDLNTYNLALMQNELSVATDLKAALIAFASTAEALQARLPTNSTGQTAQILTQIVAATQNQSNFQLPSLLTTLTGAVTAATPAPASTPTPTPTSST